MIIKTLRSEQTTAFLIGLLLTVYLVLRAVYTPVLHDEIATFFYFIQTKDFLPPGAHWDANNHLLNSFLGNVSFQLFGDAPWALRLPNVLLYPVFLMYSWKITNRIHNTTWKWSIFLALACTTYVFEYFALCRGYGMSLGFLMASLYFVVQSIDLGSKKRLYLAIGLLFLAVAANLTLIYIYLMIALISVVIMWFMPAKNLFIKKIGTASFGVISLLLISPLLYFTFELKARGALYYGGDSFIDYTIKPLLKLILGSDSSISVIGSFVVFSALVIIFTAKLSYDFCKKIVDSNHLFIILLVGSVAAILLSHILLGVNYPEDRTAMYLVPLYLLALGFGINQLKWKHTGFLALPLLFFPVKFISEIGVDQARFAMEERNVQSYFDYIHHITENQDFKPAIGGYATQSFCWYYMNYRAGGAQNAMLYSEHPDTICDYQIVNHTVSLSRDFKSLYKKLNKESVHDLNLYKRVKPLNRVLISSIDSVTNWNHSNDEFFNLLEMISQEDWASKSILVEIEGIIHAPNKPFYATLSVSQKDADWNELGQERVVLSWLRYDWSDDTKVFHQSIVLPNISEHSAHIQVFLWNIKSQPFLVKDCKIKIYLLH